MFLYISVTFYGIMSKQRENIRNRRIFNVINYYFDNYKKKFFREPHGASLSWISSFDNAYLVFTLVKIKR